MSPASDSAMDTWQRVLEIEKASRGSPKVLSALAGFATEMRTRAAEEEKAGRLVVSSDLDVFAEQATRLLERSPATVTLPPPPPPAAVSRTLSDSQTLAAGRAVPTARDFRGARRCREPDAGAAVTGCDQSTGKRKAPGGRSGALPRRQWDPHRRDLRQWKEIRCRRLLTRRCFVRSLRRPHPDQSAAGFYAKRGDEMMAIKDITAARKFYEFAANAGNARAATALARTLDSRFRRPIGLARSQSRSGAGRDLVSQGGGTWGPRGGGPAAHTAEQRGRREVKQPSGRPALWREVRALHGRLTHRRTVPREITGSSPVMAGGGR